MMDFFLVVWRPVFVRMGAVTVGLVEEIARLEDTLGFVGIGFEED